MSKESSTLGFLKEMGDFATKMRIGRNLGVSVAIDLAHSALGLSTLQYGARKFTEVSQSMAEARANISGAIEGQRGTNYCHLGLGPLRSDGGREATEDAIRTTADLYNRMLRFYSENGVEEVRALRALRGS